MSGQEDAPRLISERITERYVLDAQIGAGGMATVYVGRDTTRGSREPVAIKRLHPWLAKDPEFVAALLDEGRVVSHIAHPNVVALREVVNHDNGLFLVLEYVHGEPLSVLLRTARAGGPVPAAIACALTCDLLRGLHAAHEATDEKGRPLGIVHRDVSPQNVLVGVDGRAHLLDFGVAKAAGRMQSTRNGSIKGKLQYMAPEQLRGGLVTRKSDVYAAAVVLWEMLAGRRLFEARQDADIILERSQKPMSPPSAVAPGSPPALDAVTMRGLAREARERYATAEEMARDIERAVRPAAPAKVRRWMEAMASENLGRRAALLSRERRGGRGGASRSVAPGAKISGAKGWRARTLVWAALGLAALLLLSAWGVRAMWLHR